MNSDANSACAPFASVILAFVSKKVKPNMAFILSAQRHASNYSEKNWHQYMEYLNSIKERFPKNAFKIATSDLWYSFDKASAPHDSGLLHLLISDNKADSENDSRYCSINIELQSAYSGRITLNYPKVVKYQLSMPGQNSSKIHGDWLYDEFSLSDDGFLIHTIEWADGSDWIITTTDLIHEYLPEK